MDHAFKTPLTRGTLIRRYKRFLADVELENGKVEVVHCANTGSMIGCSDPGSIVYISRSDNPKRKLQHSLELVETPTSLIGVNTALPNRIVEAAILRGAIPELRGYSSLRREVRYGENSRIDILLEDEKWPPCYVEVKNVTLRNAAGIAEFPDAVTARGKKHVLELEREVREGNRAAMVFLVQRGDCSGFSPADQIDAEYGEALRFAAKNGVLLIALQATPSPKGIHVEGSLPVVLP